MAPYKSIIIIIIIIIINICRLRPVANETGLIVAVWPIYRMPLGVVIDAKAITTKHHITVLKINIIKYTQDSTQFRQLSQSLTQSISLFNS